MFLQRTIRHLSIAGLGLLATLGSANAQCMSDRISSSNGASGDIFGRAMAISGDDLLVGAARTDRSGFFNSGSVYRFLRTPNGFVEQEEWVPFDPVHQANFGEYLAIDGDWAAVGAPFDDDNGAGSGSVYLWNRVGGTWVAGPKLVGSEVDSGDNFGISVAISDGPTPRLIVGAYWHAFSSGSTGGAVYAFEYDSQTTTWNETQIIRSADLSTGDFFGRAVAFDGSRLIVGATSVDDLGGGAGAVYVFELQGSQFQQTAKILPPSLGAGDNFGRNLTLDGDRLAASGRELFVYSLQGGTWVQEAILVGSGSTSGYADSVNLSGDLLVASKHYFGSGGGAWLWDRSSGNWLETMTTAEESVGDYYGRRTILDGDHFLVSGDSANVNGGGLTVGEVYSYAHSGPDCNANGVADACDIYSGSSADSNSDGTPDECSGSSNYCSSSTNSTGNPAVISMTGSASVGTNAFVLNAGPVPNVPGLFFYGQNQVDLAFGNGRLCVGSPQYRLPAVFSAGNQATYTYDLSQPPVPAGLITPGSTWNFQFWFRDPGVGAQFDTTDGLSIPFTL